MQAFLWIWDKWFENITSLSITSLASETKKKSQTRGNILRNERENERKRYARIKKVREKKNENQKYLKESATVSEAKER